MRTVSQLILSCVPNVKQPLALITNVNVLLVAIQGASNNGTNCICVRI